MSTVLRGLPSGFRVTTIRWHHLDGCPCGTRSNTPRFTSSCNCCFSFSSQWSGMREGVWTAFPSAARSAWSFKRGPVTPLRTWWVHVFHVDAPYVSLHQAFIFALFSGQTGYGGFTGLSGGSNLTGHPQGAVWPSTVDTSIAAPIFGKSFGITPSWIRASLDT